MLTGALRTTAPVADGRLIEGGMHSVISASLMALRFLRSIQAHMHDGAIDGHLQQSQRLQCSGEQVRLVCIRPGVLPDRRMLPEYFKICK